MLDKLKKFIVSIKTPQEKKTDWIGLGLAEWFGFSESHPLHIAGVHHDAGQDAIEVYFGYKTVEQCSEKPIYYQDLVRLKLNELKAFIRANENIRLGQAIRLWAFKDNDSFKMLCTKLAKTRYRFYQGKFFYSLVNIHSFFKYRERSWEK